jgi:hypothetical protein
LIKISACDKVYQLRLETTDDFNSEGSGFCRIEHNRAKRWKHSLYPYLDMSIHRKLSETTSTTGGHALAE